MAWGENGPDFQAEQAQKAQQMLDTMGKSFLDNQAQTAREAAEKEELAEKAGRTLPPTGTEGGSEEGDGDPTPGNAEDPLYRAAMREVIRREHPEHLEVLDKVQALLYEDETPVPPPPQPRGFLGGLFSRNKKP